MWRRVYLLLVLVRLYCALAPSYIHPDEHFQGPEVIAGEVFGYPIYKTWEFTSDHPVRSIFPVWFIYGWPLTVLKWLWEGFGEGPVPPIIAFYCLRSLMFLLSLVLSDWALHELLPAPGERRTAIMLVASSYVTWTLQTHTFSNSIETVAVLWSLVLIARLADNIDYVLFKPCCALAFLAVFGLFNRITFPAYLVIPLTRIAPGLYQQPLRIPIMLTAGLLTIVVAVTMDTNFYGRGELGPTTIIITPWNNFAYNSDVANLAQHGLHPFWQHLVANLPQLLGPAFPLIFLSSRKGMPFWSAITGSIALSCFPHQEPRFLLPAIPLLLSSIKLPQLGTRYWLSTWIIFNVLAGTLFGVYHQGGVVPAQTWIAQQQDVRHALWWKTYSPPRWLLDGKNYITNTTDLMGIPGSRMIDQLKQAAYCEASPNRTILVAPSSATFLDAHTSPDAPAELVFTRLWQYRRHIGLDDLDFGEDGVRPTLQRVIGRRGLVVWQVSKTCT